MDAAPRTNRRVVLAILACVFLAFLLTLSAAQDPVQSFDQLNTRLKVGDTIWVTDAQGREIKGKIRDLSPSALTLEGDPAGTLPADTVRLVTVRMGRPVGKGALYGLLAGALAGAVIGATGGGDDGGDGGGWYIAIGAGIFGGIGAGAGAVVGALIPGKPLLVYRAPGAAGLAGSSQAWVSIAPVITPRTKGVAVSFAF